MIEFSRLSTLLVLPAVIFNFIAHKIDHFNEKNNKSESNALAPVKKFFFHNIKALSEKHSVFGLYDKIHCIVY